MFGSISRLFKSAGLKKKKEDQSPFAAPPISEETATTSHQFDQAMEIDGAGDESQEVLTTGDLITLPLPSIMKQIPKELLGIDASTGAAKCKFSIPKDVAVKQLESGSVKVTFGSIRKSVPSGIFINTSSNDKEEIALPLHLIISQVDAELYQRKETQQVKEIPDSIQDLFGPKGQGLTDVRILNKDELRNKKSSPGTTKLNVAKKKLQPSPAGSDACVTPPHIEPNQTIPTAIEPLAVTDQSREESPAVISGSSLLKALGENQETPAIDTKTSAPIAFRSGSSSETISAPIPAQKSAPVTHLTVPLSQLRRSWPESVLEEIQSGNLDGLNCEFPIQEVKSGLQQGKLSFSWSQVRSWLNPSPESEGSSPHGELILELPLDVVTPLFLREVVLPSRQACPNPSGIPDVFANKQRNQEEAKKTESSKLPPPSSSLSTGKEAVKSDGQVNRLPTRAPVPASAINTPSPGSGPDNSQAVKPSLKLALASVSATWPPEIQQEIQSLGLSSKHLDIASDYLETGLRAGKVELSWGQVLSWLSDGPEVKSESAHSDLTLKLPLDIIAPMYFQLRQATETKKLNVPKDIPDVFSAKGEKLASPSNKSSVTPTTLESSHTSAAVKTASVPSQPEPPKEKKRPTNIAELFGEPKKKSWTPNEIVQRAAQLQGVSGALIALQDGLLVAGCLPPGWKTETFAAFIPQMFGRMTQYTKELSLGNLHCLTLNVEKGLVQVFSAGLIYFAVVGKHEIPLPSEDLEIIANELSRHTK